MTMTKPSEGGNSWMKSSNHDCDGGPTRSTAIGARSAHSGGSVGAMVLATPASAGIDATTRVRCTTEKRLMSVRFGKYSCLTSAPESDADCMDCSATPVVEKADARMVSNRAESPWAVNAFISIRNTQVNATSACASFAKIKKRKRGMVNVLRIVLRREPRIIYMLGLFAVFANDFNK
jgi:hypothetical protein